MKRESGVASPTSDSTALPAGAANAQSTQIKKGGMSLHLGRANLQDSVLFDKDSGGKQIVLPQLPKAATDTIPAADSLLKSATKQPNRQHKSETSPAPAVGALRNMKTALKGIFAGALGRSTGANDSDSTEKTSPESSTSFRDDLPKTNKQLQSRVGAPPNSSPTSAENDREALSTADSSTNAHNQTYPAHNRAASTSNHNQLHTDQPIAQHKSTTAFAGLPSTVGRLDQPSPRNSDAGPNMRSGRERRKSENSAPSHNSHQPPNVLAALSSQVGNQPSTDSPDLSQSRKSSRVVTSRRPSELGTYNAQGNIPQSTSIYDSIDEVARSISEDELETSISSGTTTSPVTTLVMLSDRLTWIREHNEKWKPHAPNNTENSSAVSSNHPERFGGTSGQKTPESISPSVPWPLKAHPRQRRTSSSAVTDDGPQRMVPTPPTTSSLTRNASGSFRRGSHLPQSSALSFRPNERVPIGQSPAVVNTTQNNNSEGGTPSDSPPNYTNSNSRAHRRSLAQAVDSSTSSNLSKSVTSPILAATSIQSGYQPRAPAMTPLNLDSPPDRRSVSSTNGVNSNNNTIRESPFNALSPSPSTGEMRAARVRRPSAIVDPYLATLSSRRDSDASPNLSIASEIKSKQRKSSMVASVSIQQIQAIKDVRQLSSTHDRAPSDDGRRSSENSGNDFIPKTNEHPKRRSNTVTSNFSLETKRKEKAIVSSTSFGSSQPASNTCFDLNISKTASLEPMETTNSESTKFSTLNVQKVGSISFQSSQRRRSSAMGDADMATASVTYANNTHQRMMSHPESEHQNSSSDAVHTSRTSIPEGAYLAINQSDAFHRDIRARINTRHASIAASLVGDAPMASVSNLSGVIISDTTNLRPDLSPSRSNNGASTLKRLSEAALLSPSHPMLSSVNGNSLMHLSPPDESLRESLQRANTAARLRLRAIWRHAYICYILIQRLIQLDTRLIPQLVRFDVTSNIDPDTLQTLLKYHIPKPDEALSHKVVAYTASERQDQETEKISQLLSMRIRSFASLSVEQRKMICKSMNYENYPKGKLILKEGHMFWSMYFILSGQVDVFTVRDAIKYRLSILNAGDMIGEQTLKESYGDHSIDQKPRMASVSTTAPTELLRIDKDDYYNMLRVTNKASQEKQISSVQALPNFSMQPDNIERVIRMARFVKYQPHEVIVSENSRYMDLFWIISGTCRCDKIVPFIRRKSPKGIESDLIPFTQATQLGKDDCVVYEMLSLFEMQVGDFFPALPEPAEPIIDAISKRSYLKQIDDMSGEFKGMASQYTIIASAPVEVMVIAVQDYVSIATLAMLRDLHEDAHFKIPLAQIQESYLERAKWDAYKKQTLQNIVLRKGTISK